jgi:threonine/homoserine/homoserine lactone efflux protein
MRYVIGTSAVMGVCAVALGMVLTPGPNMTCLVSRMPLAQGRRAALVSLAGVALGFLAYLVAANLGLSLAGETTFVGPCRDALARRTRRG